MRCAIEYSYDGGRRVSIFKSVKVAVAFAKEMVNDGRCMIVSGLKSNGQRFVVMDNGNGAERSDVFAYGVQKDDKSPLIFE